MLRLSALVIVLSIAASLVAQGTETCSLPPIQVTSAKGNFFTEAQENQLGDVIAEQWQQELTIIHEGALTGHMREVGAKLVAQLPTTMTYHFEIIELPEANAFSLPGGRIYVSRKIIALAQSDDELAGLLAHELGHEVTHQHAAMISRIWHQLFGINQVTSAEEIRQRYHQMLDMQARAKVKDDREEDDQLSADSVALQAMARAGYNPTAFASLFNRLTETNNGRSSFFSDLFGTTAPNVARFKKLQKVLATFPLACSAQPAQASQFTAWREQVIGYDRSHVAYTPLPGLLWERKLYPALRPDVTDIHYSSDGKHLLVQDSGGVEILTHNPLAPLFHINAPGARHAQFSADGQTVSFYHGTTDPRIETWSVEQKQRLSVHELHMKRECVQSELSSDGSSFACVAQVETNNGYQFNLVVYDVASAAEVLRSQNVLDAVGYEALFLELEMLLGGSADNPLPLVHLHFSPDGRFLILARDSKVIAFDVIQRASISLPGPMKGKLGHGFNFLSQNQIIARWDRNSPSALILSFPDGRVLRQGIKVGGGQFLTASDQNFVLLRFKNSDEHPLYLIDLNANKVAVAFKHWAADISGNEVASERSDGEIALDVLPKGDTKTKIDMPDSQLGRLQTINVSEDLSWIAFSDRTRGGVWSLHTGDRVYHLRDFRGAYFSGVSFHAEMPKQDKNPHGIAHLNLAVNSVDLTALKDGDIYEQHGPVLLDLKDSKAKDGQTYGSRWNVIDARDVVSQKALWSKTFSKRPDDFYAREAGDSIAFVTRNKDNIILDFHRLSTGGDLGVVTVHTNKDSFAVRDAMAAGDRFLIADNEHRVTLYDKSGQEIAKVFGSFPTPGPSNGQFAASTEDQDVTLYDLASGQKIQTLHLPVPEIYYHFDSSGKRLLVFTADQTAYVFDTDKLKNLATKGSQ